MCRGHSRASPEGGSSRAVGCRMGTGEKSCQGPVPGCLASVDPSRQQLRSTKQTLGSTISHGTGLLCPQASIPRHVWLSVGPLEQALRLQYARTSLWGSWVPALRSKLRRGWTMGAELVKKH